MINFEEEIAKRDARIAGLEAQAGDGTSSNKYRAELYDEVWQAARDMGYGNVTGALQDLAALKAQQPSAGVVVGALVSALEGIVHDERVPNEVSQDCAALLIEARRLNPCRAQDVPGWADAVEACAKLCEERAAYYESGDDDAPGSRRGNACRHCADVIRYNLAAAPSAKKESDDE